MPAIVARFVDCHVFRVSPSGDGKGAGRRAEPGTEEWLVMKRAPGIVLGGTWQMVQGHIEAGETAYQAAHRELLEETGVAPEAFYQASYVNRFYLAESDQIILSPVFCARLPADAEVVLSEEHTEHRWVPAEEAMEAYPWPGQRKSLQICREQFVQGASRPESEISDLLRDPQVDRDAADAL